MRQFAAMAGISNPYLSQIERGLRAPSLRVVDAIANSLDTTTEALYEQAGMRPPGDPQPESSTRTAIEDDPQLTRGQRRALLEVYDCFMALNTRDGVR